MSLVSCFFFYGQYGKSVSHKLVSPVNDFNVILYGHSMIFMFFLKFFSTNDFQFLIYIVPSNSKVLNTSRPKGNGRL